MELCLVFTGGMAADENLLKARNDADKLGSSSRLEFPAAGVPWLLTKTLKLHLRKTNRMYKVSSNQIAVMC